MECPICGKIVSREYMEFTRDCHGIPFRLVCVDCYDLITTTTSFLLENMSILSRSFSLFSFRASGLSLSSMSRLRKMTR